jgi:hypothetical protein
MNNIKVIANEQIIKNDYDSNDPQDVFKVELDEELDNVIPSVELECKKTINEFNLSQGQVIEIYTGDTGEDRVFYGYIMDIKQDGTTFKIQANMETINLIKRRANKVYVLFEE